MRIYDEQNPYQGITGGGGFNPVREPDVASGMEKELRAGERRNNLFYESLRENDRQRARIAEFQAKQNNQDIGNNLKTLGQFSKTINAYADSYEAQKQEEKAVQETMGFLNSGSQYLSQENQNRLQNAEQIEEEVSQTGPQVAQVALELDEQGNEIVAQAVRTSGNAGANIVGTDRIRSLAAISQYPSFINGWLASNAIINVNGNKIPVNLAARSGDPQLIDAAISAGMAQFVQSRGLANMNLASVNRLANSLIQTNGSIGGGLMRDGIKSQQEGAKDMVESSAFNLAQSGQVSPQDVWNTMSEQAFIQPTGWTRTEANKNTVKNMIAGYVASGNVEALEDLLTVQQKPGQKGTELRNTFGPEIQAGIKQAQQRRDGIRSQTKKDLEAGMYENLNGVKTTAERLQIIEETATAMEREGLFQDARTLRGKAEELKEPGTANIGDVRILDQITNGQITTVQQLQQAKGLGQLTDKGYQDAVKALGLQAENGKPATEIKDLVEAEQKGTRDSVYIAVGIKRDPASGALIAGEKPVLSPARSRVLVEAINAEQQRVANRAWNQSANLPLDQRQRAVRQALKDWRQENLYTAGGRYFIGDLYNEKEGKRNTAMDAQTRANSSFRLRQVADSPRTLTSTATPTRNRSQDFTTQVEVNGDVSDGVKERFNPLRYDRVFDQQETESFLEDWKAGKTSPELANAAQQLGVSPLSLINSQSIAYGLGAVQPQNTSSMGMGFPVNTSKYLQSQGITMTPERYSAMPDKDRRILTNPFATPKQLARALGSSSSVSRSTTPFRGILDLIGSGEGDWNSANRGNAGDTPGGVSGLSSMTYGQWKNLQAQGYFALGRYQFIPETLRQAASEIGLSDSTVMSPDTQDKLAIQLMVGGKKRPRLAAYLQGRNNNIDAALDDLALEWASVASASGGSAYAGVGNNAASISRGSARQQLVQLRQQLLSS